MINFIELSLGNRIEHETKISSWMKAEKIYNCDGGMLNFRKRKQTKKNK